MHLAKFLHRHAPLPTVGRALCSLQQAQPVVDLVTDDQLGGQSPGGVGDRFGRPVAERGRAAASAVEHRAHRTGHHDGHGHDGADPLRQHGTVEVVGDRASRPVVGHLGLPAGGEDPAAEPGLGAHPEAAQARHPHTDELRQAQQGVLHLSHPGRTCPPTGPG
ncbi:hypothetical protein P1P92_33425 [Streptomyces ipomoeae]|nr:hypothetical protein [Streptomyces ipomoeae]MDX2937250.1 hypothetical protein [Streptomyces ipomoeae]